MLKFILLFNLLLLGNFVRQITASTDSIVSYSILLL